MIENKINKCEAVATKRVFDQQKNHGLTLGKTKELHSNKSERTITE